MSTFGYSRIWSTLKKRKTNSSSPSLGRSNHCNHNQMSFGRQPVSTCNSLTGCTSAASNSPIRTKKPWPGARARTGLSTACQNTVSPPWVNRPTICDCIYIISIYPLMGSICNPARNSDAGTPALIQTTTTPLRGPTDVHPQLSSENTCKKSSDFSLGYQP